MTLSGPIHNTAHSRVARSLAAGLLPAVFCLGSAACQAPPSSSAPSPCVAVFAPADLQSAYRGSADVVTVALGFAQVPLLSNEFPSPTPEHPGVAFMLPITLSKEQRAALSAFRAKGGKVVCLGLQEQGVLDELKVKYSTPKPPPSEPVALAFDPAVLPAAPQSLIQYPERVSDVSGDGGNVAAKYGDSGPAAVWLSESVAAVGFTPGPGDRERLAQLLLAILTVYNPGQAAASVGAMNSSFGIIGQFRGLGVLQAYVSQQKSDVSSRLLDAAVEAHRQALLATQESRLAEAIPRAVEAETLLRRCLYALEKPEADEVRAAFAPPSDPGQAQALVDTLRSGGLNAVFVYTGDALKAQYASTVIAPLGAGDPLADVVAAAGASPGLDVFAWHACFYAMDADKEQLAPLRDAGRLMLSGDLKPLDWLCLTNEENLKHEEAILTELVTKYPIRGVVLDFLRFPSRSYCYCTSCRDAFKAANPGFGGAWPPIGGGDDVAFWKLRPELVTRAIRRLTTAVHAARPDALVVATAFGEDRASVGQDIAGWTGDGGVDGLCPLLYSQGAAELRAQLADIQLRTRGSALLIPGRSPMTPGYAPSDPMDVFRDIATARQARCDGLALYAFTPAAGRQLAEALGAGAYQGGTAPPYRPGPTITVAPEPFPDLAPGSYPPAGGISVHLAFAGASGGEVALVGRSLEGPDEKEVGKATLAQGAADATVALPPGVWRLCARGTATLESGETPVFRSGPVLRVLSDKQWEQTAAAAERAGRLDVAVLFPGRGAQSVFEELRVGLDPTSNVQSIDRLGERELQGWDALVISDPPDPKIITSQVAEMLRTWVQDGGRLILLHNAIGHAGFPQIFLEIAGTFPEDTVKAREARVSDLKHPAAALLTDIGPTIKLESQEQVLVRPNRPGVALLDTEPPGDPDKALAAAAGYGSGRVVMCGIRLGQTDAGEDARLSRDESALLVGLVKWATEGCVRVTPHPAATGR